jgi:hypothetical protein
MINNTHRMSHCVNGRYFIIKLKIKFLIAFIKNIQLHILVISSVYYLQFICNNLVITNKILIHLKSVNV